MSTTRCPHVFAHPEGDVQCIKPLNHRGPDIGFAHQDQTGAIIWRDEASAKVRSHEFVPESNARAAADGMCAVCGRYEGPEHDEANKTAEVTTERCDHTYNPAPGKGSVQCTLIAGHGPFHQGGGWEWHHPGQAAPPQPEMTCLSCGQPKSSRPTENCVPTWWHTPTQQEQHQPRQSPPPYHPEFRKEVERRWFADPTFHAKVQTFANLLRHTEHPVMQVVGQSHRALIDVIAFALHADEWVDLWGQVDSDAVRNRQVNEQLLSWAEDRIAAGLGMMEWLAQVRKCTPAAYPDDLLKRCPATIDYPLVRNPSMIPELVRCASTAGHDGPHRHGASEMTWTEPASPPLCPQTEGHHPHENGACTARCAP